MTSFKPPRPVANLSTGVDGNNVAPSIEARELLRTTYLRALRDSYSEMQAGKHSRLAQIMQHVSAIDSGDDVYVDGNDIHNLSRICFWFYSVSVAHFCDRGVFFSSVVSTRFFMFKILTQFRYILSLFALIISGCNSW